MTENIRTNERKKRNTSQTFGIRKDKDGVMFTAFFDKASSVQIAGDFNDWRPEKNPMKKFRKEGVWKAKVPLSQGGTYRYRFVVDGHWQQDPHNDAVEPNPYNELNSLVTV